MKKTPPLATSQHNTAHQRRVGRLQPGTGWLVLASLLWLPQAGVIAWAVQSMAHGSGMDHLGWQVGGVAVLGILRALCEGMGTRKVFHHARAQVSALRTRGVYAIASASPLDRMRPASGLAASALAEQAEAVVPWLARYQPAMARVMLVSPAIALAVATQSWVAMLILVIAAPLIPLFMAIVGWRARAASEVHMVELGQMNAFLLDRLRGITTLRALGAVERTAQHLRAHAEALRQRTMRVLRIAFLSSAVLELFSALGVAMIAVYIGFHLLGYLNFGTWNGRLSLGQALWVLMLAPAFFDPLRELAAAWHDRASGQAAMQSLEQLTQHTTGLPGALAPANTLASETALRVRTHSLQPQAPGADCHLAPISLDIAAGEHIALCGPSGAGKSILLAQLAGLLPVPQGSIYLNDQALTTTNAASLRSRIGWMGQHAHIFAGSVHFNMTLGRSDIAVPTQQAALKQAGLESFMADMMANRPGASLGEGGQGLSGGEAVRLALARLTVHNTAAGLLLVDEPTAHLDPITAQHVIKALRQIATGQTLIVATHDPLLAACMDRIIELEIQPGASA